MILRAGAVAAPRSLAAPSPHLVCCPARLHGARTMGHRLSKIVTRTGDAGTTGLGDGSRVAKDSPRIDAIGERRRAQLDARRPARRSAARRRSRACLTERPARSLRPGRRAVDSRATPRSPTRTSRASRPPSSASTPISRRSRNSSCRAARAPRRSRTSRAPSAAAPSARSSTSRRREPVSDRGAPLPQPPVGPAVRARARAQPRRRAAPTCSGARTGQPATLAPSAPAGSAARREPRSPARSEAKGRTHRARPLDAPRRAPGGARRRGKSRSALPLLRAARRAA